MKFLLSAALAVLSVTAQAEHHGSMHHHAEPVAVSGAWVRATAPGAKAGAVYLTMRAQQDDALIGASTPAAERTELHETVVFDNGMMEMRQQQVIELPMAQVVQLAPQGLHIMLLGLKEPLQAGYELPLELEFANAGRQNVRVPIKPLTYQHGSAKGMMACPIPTITTTKEMWPCYMFLMWIVR